MGLRMGKIKRRIRKLAEKRGLNEEDYIYDYWQFGAMFIGLILVILLIKRCSG